MKVNFLKKYVFVIIACFAICAKAEATKIEDLDNFIKTTSSTVVNIIKSGEGENEKARKLQNLFETVVDVPFMGKFAAASFWRSLAEVEKKDYLKNYRIYLINTYIPKFRDYNGQDLQIASIKALDNDNYLVSTQIKDPHNPQNIISISYRCKFVGNSFKIRDIIGQNVSLITAQRSEFSSIFSREGIKYLINILGNRK